MLRKAWPGFYGEQRGAASLPPRVAPPCSCVLSAIFCLRKLNHFQDWLQQHGSGVTGSQRWLVGRRMQPIIYRARLVKAIVVVCTVSTALASACVNRIIGTLFFQ